MTTNTRRQSLSWPYPRYAPYQRARRAEAIAWFDQHQRPRSDGQYRYILKSHADWAQNIILQKVATYIKEVRARRLGTDCFPLHKYLHHGLSSQALAFNLLGPMMVEQDFTPFQQACAQQGIAWPTGTITAEFEHEDRNIFNEDAGQPTSIDILLQGEGGMPLFVECKFTETEFGKCSVFETADCDGRNPACAGLETCFLHYIGRHYWTLLEQYGFFAGPVGTDSICVLAMHYQFFREVLFALESGGTFVLLYDERNPAFFCRSTDPTLPMRGLMPYLTNLVPDQHRARVGAVSIQQVITAALISDQHAHWATLFAEKYGLPRDA